MPVGAGAGAAGIVAAPLVGTGLAEIPTLVGGAAAVAPGVMVLVEAAVDCGALGPGVLVGLGRVARLVFNGFVAATGPVVAAGAMEDEGAAAANVDPGWGDWLALDGVVTVGGR